MYIIKNILTNEVYGQCDIREPLECVSFDFEYIIEETEESIVTHNGKEYKESEVPSSTPEEIQASYTRLIQSILDNEAYKLGYTGMNETVEGACNSVCTYIDTGISKFDDERTCFQTMAFRSLEQRL